MAQEHLQGPYTAVAANYLETVAQVTPHFEQLGECAENSAPIYTMAFHLVKGTVLAGHHGPLALVRSMAVTRAYNQCDRDFKESGRRPLRVTKKAIKEQGGRVAAMAEVLLHVVQTPVEQ